MDRKWAIASIALGTLTALSGVVSLVVSLGNSAMIALALEGMRGFLAFLGMAILGVLVIGIALVVGGVAALQGSALAGRALRLATTLGVVLAVMGVLVPGLFLFPRMSNPKALEGGTLQAEMAATIGWRVASFCLQAAAFPLVLLLAQRGFLAEDRGRLRSRAWLIGAVVFALPALSYCGFLLLGAATPSPELLQGASGRLMGIAFVLGLLAARYAWPLVLICAIGGTLSRGAGRVQHGVLWALAILACVAGAEALAFR